MNRQAEDLLFGQKRQQHHCRSKMIKTTKTRRAKAAADQSSARLAASLSLASFSRKRNHMKPSATSTKLSTVILYTILIGLQTTLFILTFLGGSNNFKGGFIMQVGAIAPTIDYSHNMRILKLPHSTPVGSLIYRLKGSDGDPNSQLVFGLSGIVGRALVDVVPVAHSWNEADVFLRAPLEEPQYNLTIYVTDGNKTTQVESTILVTIDDSAIGNNNSENGEQVITNAGSGDPLSPFLNTRHVFHVPENTELDETIGFVVVRESAKSDLPVRFELRGKGSEKFSLKYVFGPKGQSKAELTLAQRVDYERQNLFDLKVLALNAWTNTRLDTRNVATMEIVVTVGDVQDSAPVFKNLPRSLKLTNTMKAGDILLKVEAEDGDYADQRPVNYALDASSPLSVYFDIDKSSGEIKLIKSMAELSLHAATVAWESSSWSVLTVYASEVPDTSSYDHLWPPMYAKAELPLILVDVINEPPQFIGGWQTSDSRQGTRILHGYLTEPPTGNCAGAGSISDEQQVASGGGLLPQPIIVRWFTNSSTVSSSGNSQLVDTLSRAMNGRPSVLDLGLGSNGTFQLSLEGQDAQLFQLEPNFPVTKQTTFTLSLADSVNRSIFDLDLDHDHHQQEKHQRGLHISSSAHLKPHQAQRSSFSVDIVASDFGSPQPMSSRIKCLIELLDINDNKPQFDTDLYSFTVYENAPVGQLVGVVHARDPDSGLGGRVKYTSLTGFDNQLFRLDPDSGQVTLEGHLDREKKASYLFLIEARDSSGLGGSNQSQLLITVLDINDNAPIFTQSHYDAVLLADGTFHQPLVVRAVDADEPDSANSQVAYEITAGNQNDQFVIDSVSGVIYPAITIGVGGGGGGADPTLPPGNSGKISNLVPQIPPILTEPIVPYSPSNSQSGGKILPTTATTGARGHHEIEETTWSPFSSAARSRQRDEPPPIDTGDYRENRTVHEDSHVVQFTNATHIMTTTTTTNGKLGGSWPRSTESQIEAETSATSATNKTSARQQEKPKLANLLKLPELDTDQLPALDLLMSLDSDQVGQVLPQTTPTTTAASTTLATAATTRTNQHSIETRSLLSNSQQQFSNIANANIMKLPPVTTLIVRAYDFGVPLRASTVKVNIYNQALQSRTVSVILNVTSNEQLEQMREAIERAFTSMTGSKATIESIDSLSDSSSIRVAKVKLAVPQHSLVDLTGADFGALMSALDYHGASGDWQARHQQHPHQSGHTQYNQPPTTITHYIATGDRLIPTTATANITSSGGAGGGSANVYSDIHSYAIDTSNLERRLLIYIIIVGVCILALLIIWMIYSCSREDREVKIFEKAVLNGGNRQADSYRSTGAGAAAGGAGGQQTTSKTYAKTMMSSDANGSPIGNNLAKTTSQQQQQQSGAAAATGRRQQMVSSRQAPDSSVSNANELLLLPNHTIAVKPDHYSMYNGQIWFEPSHSFASGRHGMILTGRRASSAPHSGGSLDSALHSAIGGRGSASPSQRGGRFFPNTVGYMANIASLSAAHGQPESGRSAATTARGTRYTRKRKVAPMVPSDGHQAPDTAYLAPEKPPRMSVHAGSDGSVASEDLEAGDGSRKISGPSGGAGRAQQQHRQQQQKQRRQQRLRGSLSSRSSSPASFEGAETMVLDSDQELLGFDSTGTPIIATHTRSATVKPLIMAMLDEGPASVGRTPPAASQSQPQQVVVAPLDTRSVAREQQGGQQTADTSTTTATKSRIEPESSKTAAADARKQQHSVTVELMPSETPSERDEITKEAVAGQESADIAHLDASKLPSDSKRTRDSQGDLLGELNDRLSTRRQLSETSGEKRAEEEGAATSSSRLTEAKGESSKTTATAAGSSSGVRGKLERRVVKSANSEDSNGATNRAGNLSNMKNGELLEKQSIFALTYSGLATDKPPAGC